MTWTKRGFDIIVGSLLSLAILPFIVIAAVGTAISLRCSPFFSQTRVGRDGQPFQFLKIRTLPPTTPKYAGKYELDDLSEIPWFSRTLRRLHLDELPQLFYVVLGKMSLVGPRPEMRQFHDRLTPTVAAERVSVRPGCTGLWQVSEHCNGMIYEHPEYDVHYVRNWSLRLDLWIIARTIRLMLPFGRQQLARMDELPEWATRHRSPRPADDHEFVVAQEAQAV